MTPNQTRIAIEAIQYDKAERLYEQAVIMKTAVNSAIVAAFGEESGGFNDFLDELRPKRNGHGYERRMEMPEPIGTLDPSVFEQARGGMDEWEVID